MTDHVFRNCNIVVHLPIIYFKFQADEVGQYCSGACPGLDGAGTLTGFGPDNPEAVEHEGLVWDVTPVRWWSALWMQGF